MNWLFQAACVLSLALSVASQEYQLENLQGQLAGSTLEYMVNLNDPNADWKDTVTIRVTVPGQVWVGVGINSQYAMVGAEAVIGKPSDGTVLKYNINAKSGAAIIPMSESQQTLLNTSLEQSGGKTVMTYTKILEESGEISINGDGDNIFLTAYGYSNSFGQHAKRGVYSLTLAPPMAGPDVTDSPEQSPTTAPAVGFRTMEPVLGGLKTSFQYRVNRNDPNAPNGEDTITIQFSAPKEAWVGVGFSSSGGMVPSTAVIALPDTQEVKKYALSIKDESGVNQLPEEQQTLINTGVTQSGGVTTMIFTKILEEGDEVAIDASENGSNNIIAAIGGDNTLGFHAGGFGGFPATFNEGPTAAPTPAAPAAAPTDPPEGVQIVELTGQLEGATLAYEFDTDTITMTLSVPSSGWCAVGISENGSMLGSEAIIGLPGTGEVKKYNLNAKAVSGVNEMPAEKQTLTNTLITQAGDNSLWVVHGWLAAIAWGVLCPLAIIAALFRKFIPGEGVWFQIHRFLNTSVAVLTIAAVSVAIHALNDETPSGSSADHFDPELSDGHRLIGLFVLIFVVIQVANGALRPHLPKESEDKTVKRKGWELLHRLFGVFLFCLCLYQVQLGIKWYHNIFNEGDWDETLTIYWVIAGILTLLILVGIVIRLKG
eukprot:scaffold918_cov126-Cylindrotheca_fusiformis.AAC.41